jgi:hypothetical protein|nr:MAG: hypothetical protein KatS3mg041_0854 [Bacteroidota bacterium]
MYCVYLQLENGARCLLAQLATLPQAEAFIERFCLHIPGGVRLLIQYVPLGDQARLAAG